MLFVELLRCFFVKVGRVNAGIAHASIGMRVLRFTENTRFYSMV